MGKDIFSLSLFYLTKYDIIGEFCKVLFWKYGFWGHPKRAF